MGVNLDRPDRWKTDIAASVDMYNDWFVRFAPKTYREQRKETTQYVADVFNVTSDLRDLSPKTLRSHPVSLATLRMCTCPPLAQDRLVGLSGVPKSLVNTMEKKGTVPARMSSSTLATELTKLAKVFSDMADVDILGWLPDSRDPTADERSRAAMVIADRLTGASADPIIRNEQERRQLAKIDKWLRGRGYKKVPTGAGRRYDELAPGSFAFHMNIPVSAEDRAVNIPVDVAIARKESPDGALPFLIEAKSAGDFTNVNKRRKEEAQKMTQLRATHGGNVEFVLFLCGYFDSGYLGYEAAEGIDWVWEHRIADLAEFSL